MVEDGSLSDVIQGFLLQTSHGVHILDHENGLAMETALKRAFSSSPIAKKVDQLVKSNSPACTFHKPKQEYIYRNGDEVNESFFLLRKASRNLNLYFDKEIHIEYSLLSGQQRTSSLRALTWCEYIKVSKEALFDTEISSSEVTIRIQI